MIGGVQDQCWGDGLLECGACSFQLLEAIAPLRRGATASKEDAARVDALATGED